MKVLFKFALFVGLLLWVSPLLAKGPFTFTIGADQWKQDAPATYGVATDNLLEFTGENATNRQFEFEVSHQLPLLPNVRFSTTSNEQTAGNTLAQTYVLGGEAYSVASQLSSTHQTKSHDLLFYYPLFDISLLKMDLGLLTRYQELEIATSKVGDSQNSQVDVDKIVPMLHVNVQSGIPLLGFFVFAEFNKGDSNHFYQSGIGYTFDNNLIPDVDLKLGYRKERMDFSSNDGVIFNQDLDATFAGMRIRF
ncbi:TIGR04219 family outer membrane beta-barrel protein [Psychrosphaera sp.]|nr:TIGR04219 family outer membrane beta-barrel protein [Psychrosphaera sp.]